MDVVETAWQLSDDVLFPAALETDRCDVVPIEVLDALADAGLYGLAAPAALGGLDADFHTVCEVQEALASGCLTTAFLWAQHLGLVHVLSETGGSVGDEWLGRLALGEVRAGLALGGALPEPTLRARETEDGWLLEGISPFVSGWGRIDVVHTAARTDDDDIAWLIVDAVASRSLRVDRLQLVALNATATVAARFEGLLVPSERMTMRHRAGGATPAEVLRLHAALALGVARRCLRLLGPTPLDDELAAIRAQLDELGPGIAAARAAAGEFALRAAAALMVAPGSHSLLLTDHAQRLAREGLFTLVYALRPQSRDAVSVLLQRRK
jgi:alkylation response protein AidB-like acyl-CoA dehydrogenase